MVSKLVPALALILLAGPVVALAADAPSSAPAADAKASHMKKHHASKKHKAAASSAPAAK